MRALMLSLGTKSVGECHHLDYMRALRLIWLKDARWIRTLRKLVSLHRRGAAWEACCVTEAPNKNHVALSISSFGSDPVLFAR